MGKSMDREHTLMEMDQNTKATGKMINRAALVYTISKMVIAMRESSKILKELEEEFTIMHLEINTKVNTEMTKEMAQANCI